MNNMFKKFKLYELGLSQTLAMRAINEVRQPLLKEHGLDSPVEWFVLSIVQAKETGIRVTDLANLISVNTTYITAVLNSLKSKGLVRTRSDKRDARVRLVVATSKGIKQADSIEARLRDRLEAWLDDQISPQQFENYVQVVGKIADRVGRGPVNT